MLKRKIVKFQFHKGAIRTISPPFKISSLSIFQFHKGAIRTNILVCLLTVLMDFNSIKVRLELLRIVLQRSICLFQFHKGAIRTLLEHRWKKDIPTFQFHKGAIRTDYPIPELDSIGNFNSIKVRLEQAPHHHHRAR